MISLEMVCYFIGFSLLLFAGCSYWLYKTNDTISWKQACQPSGRKENPIDLY